MIASAEEAGAYAGLVTCSSIGLAVELSRSFVQIPVFRVDQPRAERAVQLGSRIGVAATLRTTLEPTAALIAAQAQAVGKPVQINARLLRKRCLMQSLNLRLTRRHTGERKPGMIG